MAIVSITNLKRRKEDRTRTQSSKPFYEFINNLSDSLLFEILYRLPWLSVLRCKSVSKRWNSLISNPYFVKSFIHHRRQQFGMHYLEPSFTLLLQYTYDHKNILPIPSDNSDFFISRGSNGGIDFLNFLPSIVERVKQQYSFRIEASFNDLLLVYCFPNYYICNPLTKTWFTLPLLPYPMGRETIVMIGFICEPYSCEDKDDRDPCVTTRYKVVRICSPIQRNQIEMEIFSSETGEWCSSVVSSPRRLNYSNYKTIDVGVVACNTMLHWVDVDEKDNMIKGFVGFDPFNDAQQCCYIDPPTDLLRDEFISLGVFQGRLRIYQRPWLPMKACNFYVWELEDYINAGTWCLKHKVYFKDMVSDYPGLVKIAKEFHPPVDLLAFHPNDGELVFLQFRNYVVLCNMRTGVLKFAGQLQDMGKILLGNSNNFVTVQAKSAFVLRQPLFPTQLFPKPIPKPIPPPLWSRPYRRFSYEV